MFNNKNTDELKFNKLFTGIDEAILKNVYNSKNIKQIKEGEILYQRDDASEYIYLVLEGEVKIKYWGAEKTPSVMTKTKNDFFGEVEVIEKTSRRSAAIANTDCQFYLLGYDELYFLLEKGKNIGNNIENFHLLEQNRIVNEKLKEEKEKEKAAENADKKEEDVKESEVKNKIEQKQDQLKTEKKSPEKNKLPEVKKEELKTPGNNTISINPNKTAQEKKSGGNNIFNKKKNYSDIIVDEDLKINWNVDDSIIITNEEIIENTPNDKQVEKPKINIKRKEEEEENSSINKKLNEEKNNIEKNAVTKKEDKSSVNDNTSAIDNNPPLNNSQSFNFNNPSEILSKENNEEKPADDKNFTDFPDNMKEEPEVKPENDEKIPPYFIDNKTEDIDSINTDNVEDYLALLNKAYEERFYKGNGEKKADNNIKDENPVENEDNTDSFKADIPEEINTDITGNENLNVNNDIQFTHDEILPAEGAVNLNEAADNFLNILAIYSNKRKVKLYKKYESDVKVLIDHSKIYSVFYEIVKNACDAMPEGGKLFISIKEPVNGFVDIIFKDTGIGVPESIKLEIIEPFVLNGNKSKPELGLEIVKHILDEHNARFNLESELGEGASFIISLPVAE